MTKLLVTGTRTMHDAKFVYTVLDAVKDLYGFDEIVVGDAKGVDMITLNWCLNQNPRVYYEVYRAEWKKHGRAAGPIRNNEMVEICDFGIGIWDGKSRGTKHCIGALKGAKKLLMVFRYE